MGGETANKESDRVPWTSGQVRQTLFPPKQVPLPVAPLRWLDSLFSDTCVRVREERAAAGSTSASPDRPWPRLQLQQRVAQKQLWRQ